MVNETPDEVQDISVKIIKNFTKLYKKGIITHYVPNPLLLYGKKFDLRVFILISSFLPLKIYFNNEGLVWIGTVNCNLDEKNYDNQFIHLTNTILNLRNKNFSHGKNMTDETGNIWSFKAFKNYLKRKGIDHEKLFDRIKDIIIKSVLSTEFIFSKESRKNILVKKCTQLSD